MVPLLQEQFNILTRICQRGRNHYLAQKDNVGIDLFEHLEQEVNRTFKYMEKYGGKHKRSAFVPSNW